jgi:hypothetical protein
MIASCGNKEGLFNFVVIVNPRPEEVEIVEMIHGFLAPREKYAA